MNSEDYDKIAEYNLYEILDVKSNATRKEIKSNYKQLVKLLHPDRNKGDSEAFEFVVLAWTVLSDPESRKKYDSRRKELGQSRSFQTIKDKFKADLKDLSHLFKDEDDSKKDFKDLAKKLDKKHGFNQEDIDKIDKRTFDKRIDDMNKNRLNFYKELEETVEKRDLNNDSFNDVFINENNGDMSFGSDIMAFNQNPNMGLTNFSDINNFELYSDGASTLNYSSLDEAFNHSLPRDVNNSYSSHNVVTDNSRQDMERRIQEYNQMTENIKKNPEEIFRPITLGANASLEPITRSIGTPLEPISRNDSSNRRRPRRSEQSSNRIEDDQPGYVEPRFISSRISNVSENVVPTFSPNRDDKR